MSHPICAAVDSVRAALKTVSDANPTFLTSDEKRDVLVEITHAEAQLVELRLRVMADADDILDRTATKDVATWIAVHTRQRPADLRADQRLAHALDRQWHALAGALREARVNVAQARVIDRALHALPDDLPAEVPLKAEAALVEAAGEFGPKQLARLGRKILDVVAPEIAEAAEAKHLADLERSAHEKTRLTFRANGDGTTRISGLLPDHIAARLSTHLHAFTNPRRPTGDAEADEGAWSDPAGDPLARLPYPRRLGLAMCQFLETIDPGRLPIHGGDSTTLIVTIDLASLTQELGTGTLQVAGIPGDPIETLTADQVRRLACTANVVPAVLGADSELLDLGRSQRLFSRAQRRALLLRDGQCRAEGCDIPGTWSDAHHWLPWGEGGPTDIANGVLLCSHHHHRAHDPRYDAELLPNGDVRFHWRR